MAAVKDMDGSSGAGLDVVQAFEAFFQGLHLSKAMTHSYLVLIPKGDKIDTFADFKPISMCNFVNRLLSKVMAN